MPPVQLSPHTTRPLLAPWWIVKAFRKRDFQAPFEVFARIIHSLCNPWPQLNTKTTAGWLPSLTGQYIRNIITQLQPMGRGRWLLRGDLHLPNALRVLPEHCECSLQQSCSLCSSLYSRDSWMQPPVSRHGALLMWGLRVKGRQWAKVARASQKMKLEEYGWRQSGSRKSLLELKSLQTVSASKLLKAYYGLCIHYDRPFGNIGWSHGLKILTIVGRQCLNPCDPIWKILPCVTNCFVKVFTSPIVINALSFSCVFLA